MNKFILICLVSTIAMASVSAQEQAPPTKPRDAQLSEDQEPSRFSLNFGGGNPEYLVQEIQKQLKKPVNAIIPQDLRQTFIPTFNVKNVTIAELFQAIEMASRKQETYQQSSGPVRIGGVQYFESNYGFRTADKNPKDSSIWYFYHNKPPQPVASPQQSAGDRSVQFFQLAPYLGKYKVEDITTAIITGWGMLDGSPSELKFHEGWSVILSRSRQRRYSGAG